MQKIDLAKLIATKADLGNNVFIEPFKESFLVIMGENAFFKNKAVIPKFEKDQAWYGAKKVVIIFNDPEESHDFGWSLQEHIPELKLITDKPLKACIRPKFI